MKIIILGATGLVGSSFLEQSLKDERITEIRIFVRRQTGINSPKLKEFVIDFDRMENYRSDFTGDALFSALGTTRKAAGSIMAQRLVDYDYQLKAAVLARSNDVKTYVLISAANANAKSYFEYPKIKGQLEEAVLKLQFPKAIFLRPGVLMGQRKEKRMMEELAGTVLKRLGRVTYFKRLQPVNASVVARCALNALFRSSQGPKIIQAEEILQQ